MSKLYRGCVGSPGIFYCRVIGMNMNLYYAIGFSGIGVMLMLRYYNGADISAMIIGVICMVLGSINGKKWQESRKKD